MKNFFSINRFLARERTRKVIKLSPLSNEKSRQNACFFEFKMNFIYAYLKSINSTSNIKVENGGIPGVPFSP